MRTTKVIDCSWLNENNFLCWMDAEWTMLGE